MFFFSLDFRQGSLFCTFVRVSDSASHGFRFCHGHRFFFVTKNALFVFSLPFSVKWDADGDNWIVFMSPIVEKEDLCSHINFGGVHTALKITLSFVGCWHFGVTHNLFSELLVKAVDVNSAWMGNPLCGRCGAEVEAGNDVDVKKAKWTGCL